MLIRSATRADYARLGQVMFDAIRGGESPYSTAQRRAWISQVPFGQAWNARLARQHVFVAEVDGAVVGFMSAQRNEIDLAFVLPAARGRGGFRSLYERLEATLIAEGWGAVTAYASLMAQPAFSSVGFYVVHHEDVVRNDQVLNRALMKKSLKQAAN
ncbi:MAG: GNAT family N-acetyltransferase [Pelagimonas sp.]|jgi:putative acetyltransferase|nr:GNAT family N-acetyltransferase [Pelagimonas sp.]